MRINYEHPPLVKVLAALPLLGYHPPIDGQDPLYLAGAEWRFAHAFMFGSGVPVEGILARARLLPSLLPLGLGVAIFAYARRIHGDGGALLALAFFCFDPAFLGHGPIVQFDVGLAFFVFTGCTAFRAALASSRPVLYAVAGALLGLGVATKFTAVFMLPLWAVLVLLERRLDRRCLAGATWALAAAAAAVVAAYGVVLVPDFLRGFFWQIQHAREGHVTYLLGEVRDRGSFLYFPVAFLLKTPLETMGALVAAAIVLRRLPADPRTRVAAAMALAFLVLLLPSSIGIGHRYLLPAYPFLYVLLGALGRKLRIAGCLLAGLLAVRALVVFPGYIGFTNELAGSRPERYLADSNLDWGHDLPALSRYLADRGNPRPRLFYMGMDSPAARGIAFDPVPCRREPGLYAVSVNVAMGLYPRRARECVAWLKAETPIDRVGTSILIYEIP